MDNYYVSSPLIAEAGVAAIANPLITTSVVMTI
jgi:hypothetical protein